MSRHSPPSEYPGRDRFADYYGGTQGEAIRELERRTLGAGYGGNGYTTVDQANWLGEMLELGPDSLVLEIGAGAGWPGTWLAQQFGSQLVMSDVPLEGLVAGRARAVELGIERCRWVSSSGAHLPFPPGTFDFVSHSDVLC